MEIPGDLTDARRLTDAIDSQFAAGSAHTRFVRQGEEALRVLPPSFIGPYEEPTLPTVRLIRPISDEQDLEEPVGMHRVSISGPIGDEQVLTDYTAAPDDGGVYQRVQRYPLAGRRSDAGRLAMYSAASLEETARAEDPPTGWRPNLGVRLPGQDAAALALWVERSIPEPEL